MTEKEQAVFFEKLRQETAKHTKQVSLDRDETGKYTLRAGFTTTESGGGACAFETELFTAWEGEEELEILVTPQFFIAEEALPEVERTLHHVNLYTPVGAFGIFYPAERLYFRYTGFVEGLYAPAARGKAGMAESKEEAMRLLCAGVIALYEQIAVIVGNVHDALERIAVGKSTLAEETKRGTLIAQM